MSEIVKVLGITGFPCCGKTTISQFFHEEGAYVVDLDKIGHKILERKKIIKKLVDHCGQNILLEDEKRISKRELAKIILKDRDVLNFLNNLLWPEIRKKAQKEIKNIKHHNFCILDGALIFEAKMEDLCDATLFLDVSFETRAARALVNRGWSEDFLREIDDCQSLEAKNKADFIVWPEKIPEHLFNDMMLEAKKASFDIVFDYAEAIKNKHTWKTFEDKFWKE
jgi:dephospho-CoA kinase